MTFGTVDPLLQPFQLKHLQLRNRIVSTSHEPAYAEDGLPKLRYQRYHEEKAEGGIALTMIGGSANVAIDSPSTFGQLDLSDDAIIPYLRELADRVHAHGGAVMSQITHMGRRTEWDTAHWLPTLSASPLREPAHRSFPKEMEDFDIRRTVRAYGEAARRCKLGGLDGIEVSAHGGQLIDQFWSPRMNQRSDRYGGSLDNRLRFLFEVLESVRAAVGDDYIVGLRMSADDRAEGGLTSEDAISIGQRLAESGLVDFLSLTAGSATTDLELARQIQPLGSPLGGYLDLVKSFKEKVGLPIIHAGRIADLPTARHALREGCLDLVGMVRAHMADPHIVKKLEAGEEDRIRPCVGASYCLNRIYVGLDALCLHNPATGREHLIPHIAPPAERRKRVVVIGGGPAGLEAARVCAESGHEVTLFEASDQLGGQIQLAARANERQKELLSIVNWLEAEARRLGVTVRRNSYADAVDVRALDPDIVITATGGLPASPPLKAGEDLTVSTWDILSGCESAKGRRVLVFDDHGSDQALSTAERLVEADSEVEIVTPDRVVGHEVQGTLYPAYLKTFYAAGVRLTPDHRLREVRRASDGLVAVLHNAYTGELVERLVDQVVVEHGTLPNDDVYLQLRDASRNLGETDLDALAAVAPQTTVNNPDGSYQLFRVGDAVAGRNIHAAMYDARRIALSV
ncbi:FAD-dependent oxidoreductase [Streptomyces sp. LHD-70]|uniref:oxidoreductase n=1 Tax=Streptomyces sp. LHD-70 TaxID=3072140 RepID=UPI00280FFA3F|nr:FAD-dependent oxidoreductase [Streptomyces sp. LHD-70]MDQ8708111.1 FAD-dependent oxidoreductase [Streptomyces sp. LHD-70]